MNPSKERRTKMVCFAITNAGATMNTNPHKKGKHRQWREGATRGSNEEGTGQGKRGA